MRLNLSKCSGFNFHRSGWSYCINSLKEFHSSSGIFVEDFIERTFSWNLKSEELITNRKLPYSFDWVGFIHNPPGHPAWFDYYHSPQSIISREIFKDSLKKCRCLITLSDYLKEWLSKKLPEIPVVSVKHPTSIDTEKWSPAKFLQNKEKKVIQIGYWLRRMESIAELKTTYKKMWLPSDNKYAQNLIDIKNKQTGKSHLEIKKQWDTVEVCNYIPNLLYDKLSSKNIVFLELYDSSANNAIIESIARHTPIVVNKIPAVVEYLGDDYPLYYNNLNEASDIIHDTRLILSGHEYLKNMNKEWLTGKFFANDLIRKLENEIKPK